MPGDDGGASNPTDKIRDASKWLIGASAAVGAVVIAGSQLSDIGALPLCRPASLPCARLPLALSGAVLALAGIVYIMWRSVQVLLPVEVPLDDLIRRWNVVASWDQSWWVVRRRTATRHPDIAYFLANPSQVGNVTPADLQTESADAWDDLVARKEVLADVEHERADDQARASAVADVEEADAAWRQVREDIRTVLQTAQYQKLLASFTLLLRWILVPTTLVALGLTSYAWASNPPEVSVDLGGTSLVGADLAGADLSGASLDRADLARANLSGADLSGTSLKHVRWLSTVCPDGSNSSERSPETCVGHLTR